MRFSSKCPSSMWRNGELRKSVFVVHQIVEWKAGEGSRRRQFLKERSVNPVGRTIVAASAKISEAKPRLEMRITELVTGLHCECIGAMSNSSPPSRLQDSPKQNIGFAETGIKNIHIVTANRDDADWLIIIRSK